MIIVCTIFSCVPWIHIHFTLRQQIIIIINNSIVFALGTFLCNLYIVLVSDSKSSNEVAG